MTKLDELRNDLNGTFIDAFGDSEGADELFDAIVNATEERIINVLYSKRRQFEQLAILSHDTAGKWFYEDRIKDLDNYIALIKGENK